MTNNSPPAPEGFAWMPVSGELTDVALAQSSACYPLTGRPVEDSWEHRSCVWASVPEGFGTCRLMRRLGATEKPWDGCAFLGGCGAWAPKGEPMGEDHILNESVVAPNAGWYAPVRFPSGHVPDFGQTGRRYLDKQEQEALYPAIIADDGQECIPIALPPLPILDQMCAEKPGLREGIEREKAAHYAEEIDALRAELAEVTAERDEARKTPMLFSLLRLVEDAYPPEGLMRHNVTLSGADGCVALAVAYKGKWQTFTLSRQDLGMSAVEVFLEIESLIGDADT